MNFSSQDLTVLTLLAGVPDLNSAQRKMLESKLSSAGAKNVAKALAGTNVASKGTRQAVLQLKNFSKHKIPPLVSFGSGIGR